MEGQCNEFGVGLAFPGVCVCARMRASVQTSISPGSTPVVEHGEDTQAQPTSSCLGSAMAECERLLP